MGENLQIKPAIKDMKVRDILTFPIKNLNSIRVYCSDLGATMRRQYKSRKTLDGKKVEVIRLR
jgi:hypothetical protein